MSDDQDHGVRCDVRVTARDDLRCPETALSQCADCGEALCKKHIERMLDFCHLALCKKCV